MEPGGGDFGEFSAVGFGVGAAVADVEVGCEDGDVVDAVDVVHAVFVSDVFFAAQNVKDRGVEFCELVFAQVGHAGSGGSRVCEEAAVADDDGGDARVGGDFKGLQAAAGHAGYDDFAGVEFLIVGTGFVGILGDGPVDCVGEQRRFGGSAGSAFLAFGGHGADGDDEVAVGGNFGEEVDVFPRGIRASAVSPRDDWKF